MSKPITLELIKYTAHRLAQDTMGWNEPIPEFHTRFPRVLESCIAAPFQKVAQSPPEAREEVVEYVEKFIKKYLEEIKKDVS
ncbi:hypothetical protein EPN28_02645 [Patescibacteria group bacterium]|nr:MAG: hypothetical protein EPN28_02645 [Patescibacteria group bacterium]